MRRRRWIAAAVAAASVIVPNTVGVPQAQAHHEGIIVGECILSFTVHTDFDRIEIGPRIGPGNCVITDEEGDTSAAFLSIEGWAEPATQLLPFTCYQGVGRGAAYYSLWIPSQDRTIVTDEPNGALLRLEFAAGAMHLTTVLDVPGEIMAGSGGFAQVPGVDDACLNQTNPTEWIGEFAFTIVED